MKYGPYKHKFTWFAVRHRLLVNRGPCPYCGSKTLMKNGIQRDKQRYRCRACLRSCYEDRLKPIKSEAAVLNETESIAIPEDVEERRLLEDLEAFDRKADAEYERLVQEGELEPGMP